MTDKGSFIASNHFPPLVTLPLLLLLLLLLLLPDE